MMKTSDRFVTSFLKSGSYSTAENTPRSRFERCLGWSDWYAYSQMTRICLSGGYNARAGQFDNAIWRDHGLKSLEVLEGCGGRVEVDGMDHVSGLKGPAVFVGNHMSILDTLAGPAMVLVYQPVCVVIKSSLLKYPGLGDVLRFTKAINVNRVSAKEDLHRVLQQGEERLKEGISVMLFPQATRELSFNPQAFKSLGAKLAARAGVPLVPLALKTDMWGIGKVIRDFGRLDRSKVVRFRFGPAVPVEGNGKDAHRQTVDFMTRTLASWQIPTTEKASDKPEVKE
jgi:1-acyl-sn-glycerol-3-phosphate acyltransferase